MQNIKDQAQVKTNKWSDFVKSCTDRIADLFEPEEVEVTFTTEGNQVKYTYTKVEHKEVA